MFKLQNHLKVTQVPTKTQNTLHWQTVIECVRVALFSRRLNVPSHLCRSPLSGGHGGGESSEGSDGGARPVHGPHSRGPAARLFRASPRGKPPVRLQAAGALTGTTPSSPTAPERLSDDHVSTVEHRWFNSRFSSCLSQRPDGALSSSAIHFKEHNTQMIFIDLSSVSFIF